MKILVTGGTGFLGKRLVQKLLQDGNDVCVYSRHVHDDVPESVKLYTGNITDKVALRKAFFGIDIVYHLAINLNEEDPSMYDTNVLGTRNIVELCKEVKVKQLVYMSSSGVLGETHVPAKENFPYNPKTLYEKSKMESEKIIKSSGITYTIIRTTIILGPNQIWAQIFEAARRGYPIIGNGKNYFHLVYIDDVISLLALVKNNRSAFDQIFHVAAPDPKTYEDTYRLISSELGTKMSDKHVPVSMAYTASFFHKIKRRVQGKQPSLVRMRSSIDRLIRNRIISTEKARKVLGFEPKYTTQHGIRETIKYLKIARLGYSDYDLSEINRIKNRKDNPNV